MNGLEQAQRNYDRELPPSFDEQEESRPEFASWMVDLFILELSKCDDPVRMLEDYGILYDTDSAEMMRNLARHWQTNAIVVNAIAGSKFYDLMKHAALNRYNEE